MTSSDRVCVRLVESHVQNLLVLLHIAEPLDLLDLVRVIAEVGKHYIKFRRCCPPGGLYSQLGESVSVFKRWHFPEVHFQEAQAIGDTTRLGTLTALVNHALVHIHSESSLDKLLYCLSLHVKVRVFGQKLEGMTSCADAAVYHSHNLLPRALLEELVNPQEHIL